MPRRRDRMLLRIARPMLWLLLSSVGVANAQIGQGAAPSPWRIGMAFGYGERTNPLVQSDDIPILVDVDIAWFGERWFFDNGDGGYTFLDNEALTASIVGRINSDRIFFSRTNTKFIVFDSAGVPVQVPADFRPPDRDYAVEIGAELLTDGDWGAMQLAAFVDASDTHDGFELSAEYSFSWRHRRLHIEPAIGLSYKSRELNDYYWGLTAEEGRGVVPAYTADAGTNFSTRLTLGYQISREWSASIVLGYERLNSESRMSPIVEDGSVRSVFAGMARRFR